MMRISLVLSLAGLLLTHASYSRNPSYRTYILPDEQVISKCMKEVCLESFDRETGYSRKNANQELDAFDLHDRFIQSMYDFVRYLNGVYMYSHDIMSRFNIVSKMALWTTGEDTLYKCMLGNEKAEEVLSELKEAGIDIEDVNQRKKQVYEIVETVFSKTNEK
jgi:hypothetical protein